MYAACTNTKNCCFGGASATSSYSVAKCKWLTSPGGIYPGSVSFACPIGYMRIPPGRCIKNDEAEDNERPPCRSPGGSNASPATPNPISLLTGSKLLSATDFETADGLLRVSRSYRSTPMGRVEVALYPPVGMGSGWRLDLLPELHIRPYFSSQKTATLHWPDGSSWDFQRQSDGTMAPISSSMSMLPHGDFRLSFDGTWPSDLNEVETAPTTWKVIDPKGNVWILGTFNFIGEVPARYRTGLPLSRTTREGYRLDYTYGAQSQLTTVIDSFGRTIELTWILRDENFPPDFVNEPITPIAISDIALPDGTSLHYSYSPVTPIQAAVQPADRLDAVERLAANGVGVLETTVYHYEDSDFPTYVTGITDGRDVRAWDFDYDGRGRAISSAKAGGVDGFAVAYSPSSTAPVWRDVTNPLGRTSRYRYNGLTNTRLVGIDGGATTNCPADASSISYFASGQTAAGYISSTTDQEGRQTTYTRDGRGRATTITQAAGTADQRVTTQTWHATYDVPTSIVRAGLSTTYTYNATGALTSLTQLDTTTHTVPYPTSGQTRTWAFTYTPQGLLDTVDGPLPGAVDVVDYDYDSSGYLAQVTDQAGHVTQVVSVNGRGQPTEILDPNGVTTLVEYDALGRATEITRDVGGIEAVTAIEYDGAGDITKLTRPGGSWLSYTWDDARRLITITSESGETITYAYNNASRPISVDVRSQSGSIVASRTLAYDEIGRVRRLIGAGLQETGLTYDKVSNLSTLTDPRGGLYDYAFDRLDRMISEVDPELGQTTVSYDQRDNVTAVEDAENLSTTYVRNGFGDVIRQSSPDTGVTDYVVDERGLVTAATDARGVVTNFTYDALGRMLTRSYPASSDEDVSYTYDDTTGGNHGIGRLTGFTDGSGATSHRYDGVGRITQVTQAIAGDAFTTGYEYDAAGRVVNVTYPSGRVVTYERDLGGHVTGITTKASAFGISEPVVSNILYQPFYPAELFAGGAQAPALGMPHLAGLVGLTHANGLDLVMNYDADGRLTDMRTADGTTEVQDLSLSYDDGANITSITDNLDASRSQSFGYDDVGRLTYASGPYGDIDYTYDLVGNRTHRTIDDGVVIDEVYAYGAGTHRLASVTAGSLTRALGYTAAGSTSSDTRSGTPLTLAYGNSGRLGSVSASTGPLASREYSYDAAGHRVHEVKLDRIGEGIQASARSYVYDLAGHLVAEYSTLGLFPLLRYEYLWLGDTPVAMVDHTAPPGTPIAAIHTDHLGRPQKLTDASQTLVWDGQFDPFGEEHAVTATTDMPLRFPGQEWDAATALSQNWNRDYDPTLGRYIESDPIGLGGGASTYAYAAGNSMSLIDPEGLTAFCTARLHAAPWLDFGGYGPFHHTFLCSNDLDGRCGGQDRAGNGLLSLGGRSEDEFDPDRCENVPGDNSCIDRCVGRQIISLSRPLYTVVPAWIKPVLPPGLGWLLDGAQNCEEWAIRTLWECRSQCARQGV